MIIDFYKEYSPELINSFRRSQVNNYYVSEITTNFGRQIIWNKDTNVFTEFFYEDTADWLEKPHDLSILDSRFDGYYITGHGEVFGPKKKPLALLHNIDGYPEYKIRGIHRRVHRLLAEIFIPKPIISGVELQVDHIDRDRNNYSLTNLRWVSPKENCLNKTKKYWAGNCIYKAYIDFEKTSLVNAYSEEDLFNKYHTSSMKSRIRASIKRNTRSNGFYWEIVDSNLENYLSTYSIVVNESLWKLHFSKALYVHPTGLIKLLRGNKITPGSISNTLSYHQERIYSTKLIGGSNRRKLRVHDLVAEVFLNDNRPIDYTKYVVDHLDTDSLNNQLSNLRICTRSENMKNPNTLAKLSKPVIDSSGNRFISISEYARINKITPSAAIKRIKRNDGVKYC